MSSYLWGAVNKVSLGYVGGSSAAAEVAAPVGVNKEQQWTQQEVVLLQQVRERLAEKFQRSAQYPEVVGDRKLIRYIKPPSSIRSLYFNLVLL